MATKRSSSPERQLTKLNRTERFFWRQAFLVAELPTLLKGSKRISPIGAAHLAADFADAAAAEERRRFGG